MLFLVGERGCGERQKVGQLGAGAASLALELVPGAAEREEGEWVCLRICGVDPGFLPRA